MRQTSAFFIHLTRQACKPETRVEHDEKKQEDLLGLTSAVQISDTQADIAALESKLGVLQANYSALLDNTQSGAVNTLNIVESAELPTHPIGLSNTIIVAITAFAGLVLGAGAAYALEYLDDTLDGLISG